MISWTVSGDGKIIDGVAVEFRADCDAGKVFHTTVYTKGTADIRSDASFDFSGSGSGGGLTINVLLKGAFTSPTTAQGSAQVDVTFDPPVEGVTACHTGALTWTAKSNA